MPNGPANRILRIVLQELDDLPDAELLRRVVVERDEAAFEALLRRHGPMVLNVCRRILRHTQDAEDAFQATFLVLVRRAASIGRRELLANWLYGVAYRTALEARSLRARRQAKEVQVDEMPQPAVRQDREVEPYLDQELQRLPDRYRLPIILCDLEGRTHKEAAELLGWPQGTVSGRLFRGREMLARRMARYGLTVSVAAVTQQAAHADLPMHLVVSAARHAVEAAHVLALAEGVLRAMLMTKIKKAAMILLVLASMGVGAGWITLSANAQRQAQAGVDRADQKAEGLKPAKPSKEAVQAQVKIAEANVEVARANVEVAKAQAEEAAVVIGIAEREEQAKKEGVARTELLAKQATVSRQAVQEAENTYEKAKGEKEAKKVAYRVALARVKVAEAQVKVAEAQVLAARVGS